MSTKRQKLIVFACSIVFIILVGCSLVQDAVTPCWYSQEAKKYVEDANALGLPAHKPLFGFYTSVFDAEMLDKQVEFVHIYKQINEDIRYSFVKSINQFHIAASRELQAKLFSPTGPIGILLGTALGGTACSFLVPRPVDSKKLKEDKVKIAELEKKVNGKETT